MLSLLFVINLEWVDSFFTSYMHCTSLIILLSVLFSFTHPNLSIGVVGLKFNIDRG
jgi:hypothetical protein